MTEMTQKQRSRARILDEAAKAMRAQGADGIGVAALMKRAGLTHGGFYAHFENRDDLVAHAIDRMFADSDELLRRTLEQDDAAKGLRALIDHYLSDTMRAAVDRGCPLPGLSGEAARMPEQARARFNLGIDRFRAVLENALRAIGAPDAPTLAASVLAELVGAMALARAESDDARASAALAAARQHLKQRLGILTEAPNSGA